MAPSVRVLVVDDDDFARVTLAGAIRDLGGMVVADTATVADTLAAARARPVDVAVLDLHLGGGPTGIDLAHALRREHPHMGVVILSGYAEPRLAGANQQPLPDGALYITKASVNDLDVLARALRRAVHGGPGGTGPQAEARGEAPADPRLASLSDQQVEIMRLVAEGLSNAEIARRRAMAEPAVEKAVARLIRHFAIQADRNHNQRVLIARLYDDLARGGGPSTR